MKATEARMGDLHGLTAELLITQLGQMQRGEIEPDPRLIANAIKFLKDNNVECTSDDMKNMLGLEGLTLPEFKISDLEGVS
jgi:hypothetical protein